MKQKGKADVVMHQPDSKMGADPMGGYQWPGCRDVGSGATKRQACRIRMSLTLLLLILVLPRLAMGQTPPASLPPDAVEGNLNPVLEQLATRNAELALMLEDHAAESDPVPDQREQAEKRRKNIESALADIENTMKIYGRTEGLGRLLLRPGLVPVKKRRPTKPTRTSVEKRIKSKKIRGEIKRNRRDHFN